MTPHTINARLVKAAVGLPPVWRCINRHGRSMWADDVWSAMVGKFDLVDLDNPQTLFGVAVQLDEWEEISDPAWGVPENVPTWAARVAMCLGIGPRAIVMVCQDLINCIEQIGREEVT